MSQTKTAFEIQRRSNGGFGLCRAPQVNPAAVLDEMRAIKRDDPKGEYQIVERQERIVNMDDLLGMSQSPTIG